MTVELSALTLDGMGVALPEIAGGHPNRTPFAGVLTRLDEPSDRPPSVSGGQRGHRVLIPAAVAEAALPTLIGMAVDVTPDLAGHDSRRKIGVITEAWIDGQDLRVSGHLFAKDFSAEVSQLRRLSPQGLLGMSFEITGVDVADPQAPVWVLRQLVFTGAAILKRDAAAYGQTMLIAASRAPSEEELSMTLSALTQSVAASQDTLSTVQAMLSTFVFSALAADAVSGTVQATDMAQLSESVNRLANKYAELAAAFGYMQSMQYAMEGMVGCMRAMATGLEAVAAGTASAVQATLEQTDFGTPMISAITAAFGTSAVLAAVGELLTDSQTGATGKLLTDQTQDQSKLKTDTPARKTFAATGEYEAAIAKYHLEADKTYSDAELNTALKDVSDPVQRLAVKIALEDQGKLRQ